MSGVVRSHVPMMRLMRAVLVGHEAQKRFDVVDQARRLDAEHVLEAWRDVDGVQVACAQQEAGVRVCLGASDLEQLRCAVFAAFAM